MSVCVPRSFSHTNWLFKMFFLSVSRLHYVKITLNQTRNTNLSSKALYVHLLLLRILKIHWMNLESLPTIEFVLFSWRVFPYKIIVKKI